MLEENKIGFNLMYALRCAIQSDNLPQIVKIFAEHEYLTPDSYFHGGSSALHYACSIGAIDCVNYFLKVCKCNPNSTSSQYGMAPAHMAAIHGKLDIISLLHEFKADLRQVDNEGENILHKAVLCGDINFIQMLTKVYRLESLLTLPDKNSNVPVQFLQELVNKGLHPKQLSKDTPDNTLPELLSYLRAKTEEYPTKSKRYFYQLRLLLKTSII